MQRGERRKILSRYIKFRLMEECKVRGMASRIARETGAKFNPVHYRGLAPMMTDMLAGTIEVAVIDLFAGREHFASGRFRALAVCSDARLPQLPGVPTVAHSS